MKDCTENYILKYFVSNAESKCVMHNILFHKAKLLM